MQTQPVQITGYDQKNGTTNGRAWTVHIFQASDGKSYSTVDQTIANQGFGAQQSQAFVVLEFNEEQKGQYVNNRLTGVQPAAQPVLAPQVITPDASAATALTQPSPVIYSNAGNNPDAQAAKELRIMRQSGLGYAIAAVQAGIWQPSKGMHSVLKYAEYLATDFFLNGPPKVDGDDSGIPF